MTSEKKIVADCGLLIGLIPVLVAPVWVAGGVYRAWQWPLIPLAFWAWLWFWIVPGNDSFPSRKDRWIGMMKSPVVWLSVLFLAYLALQTWNNGRIRTFDFENNRWVYSPPPHPRLPGSFTFDESFEMIRWFFPALTVWLILNSIKELRIRFWLYSGVITAAALNAVVSILHLSLGWDSIYNLGNFMGKHPYGSFGYPNHAASFFVLMMGLGMGLFLQLQSKGFVKKRQLVGCFVCLLLITLAGLGSLSRFALFCIPLIGCTGVLIWLRINRNLVCRHKLIFSTTVVCVLAGSLVMFFKNEEFIQEKSAPVLEKIFDVSDRETVKDRIFTFQVKAAMEVWKTYPLYGTGGWGVRYEMGMHVLRENWGPLPWAFGNVHNDPVQFLAEFGLVGCGLLLGVFLFAGLRCIRDLFSRPSSGLCLWADPLRLFCWVALTLVCAQSFIDFPFRSPAILLNAVLLLHVASTRSDGAPPSA